MLHPIDYRLAKNKFWLSTWNSYSLKNYRNLILNDKILNALGKIFANCFKITFPVAAPWTNFRKFRKYSQYIIGFDGRRAIRLGPNKIKKLPNFIIPEDYNIIRFSDFSILKVFFLIDQNLDSWSERQSKWRTPLLYFNMRFNLKNKNKNLPFFRKNFFNTLLEKKNFNSTDYFMYLINLLNHSHIRRLKYFDITNLNFSSNYFKKNHKSSLIFYFYYDNFKLLNKIRNNYFLFYLKNKNYSKEFSNSLCFNKRFCDKSNSSSFNFSLGKFFTGINIKSNSSKSINLGFSFKRFKKYRGRHVNLNIACKSENNFINTNNLLKNKTRFTNITNLFLRFKQSPKFKAKKLYYKYINFLLFTSLKSNSFKLLANNNVLTKGNVKPYISIKNINISVRSLLFFNYYKFNGNVSSIKSFKPILKNLIYNRLRFFKNFAENKYFYFRYIKYHKINLVKNKTIINKITKASVPKQRGLLLLYPFLMKENKDITGFINNKKQLLQNSKLSKLRKTLDFELILIEKLLWNQQFVRRRRWHRFNNRKNKGWVYVNGKRRRRFKRRRWFIKASTPINEENVEINKPYSNGILNNIKKKIFKLNYNKRIYSIYNYNYWPKAEWKKFLSSQKWFKKKPKKRITYKIFSNLDLDQQKLLKKRYFLVFKKKKIYMSREFFYQLGRPFTTKLKENYFIVFNKSVKNRFNKFWLSNSNIKQSINDKKNLNYLLWSRYEVMNRLSFIKKNTEILKKFWKKKKFFWKNKINLLNLFLSFKGLKSNTISTNGFISQLMIKYKLNRHKKLRKKKIGFNTIKNNKGGKLQNKNILLNRLNNCSLYRYLFSTLNYSLYLPFNRKIKKACYSYQSLFLKFFKVTISKPINNKNFVINWSKWFNTNINGFLRFNKRLKLVDKVSFKKLGKKSSYFSRSLSVFKKFKMRLNNIKIFRKIDCNKVGGRNWVLLSKINIKLEKKRIYRFYKKFLYNKRKRLNNLKHINMKLALSRFTRYYFRKNNFRLPTKGTLIKNNYFTRHRYKVKFANIKSNNFFLSLFSFSANLPSKNKIKILLNDSLSTYVRVSKFKNGFNRFNNMNSNFSNSFLKNYRFSTFSITGRLTNINQKYLCLFIRNKIKTKFISNKTFIEKLQSISTKAFSFNLHTFLNTRFKNKFSKHFQHYDIHSWWDIWWTDKKINDWRAYSKAEDKRLVRLRPYSIRSMSKIQRYKFHNVFLAPYISEQLPITEVLSGYKRYGERKKLLRKNIGKLKVQRRWRRSVLKSRRKTLFKNSLKKNSTWLFSFKTISLKIWNEYFQLVKAQHRKVQEIVDPLKHFKKRLKRFVKVNLFASRAEMLKYSNREKQFQFFYFKNIFEIKNKLISSNISSIDQQGKNNSLRFLPYQILFPSIYLNLNECLVSNYSNYLSNSCLNKKFNKTSKYIINNFSPNQNYYNIFKYKINGRMFFLNNKHIKLEQIVFKSCKGNNKLFKKPFFEKVFFKSRIRIKNLKDKKSKNLLINKYLPKRLNNIFISLKNMLVLKQLDTPEALKDLTFRAYGLIKRLEPRRIKVKVKNDRVLALQPNKFLYWAHLKWFNIFIAKHINNKVSKYYNYYYNFKEYEKFKKQNFFYLTKLYKNPLKKNTNFGVVYKNNFRVLNKLMYYRAQFKSKNLYLTPNLNFKYKLLISWMHQIRFSFTKSKRIGYISHKRFKTIKDNIYMWRINSRKLGKLRRFFLYKTRIYKLKSKLSKSKEYKAKIGVYLRIMKANFRAYSKKAYRELPVQSFLLKVKGKLKKFNKYILRWWNFKIKFNSINNFYLKKKKNYRKGQNTLSYFNMLKKNYNLIKNLFKKSKVLRFYRRDLITYVKKFVEYLFFLVFKFNNLRLFYIKIYKMNVMGTKAKLFKNLFNFRLATGFKVPFLVKVICKKLNYDNGLVGCKIGFFGRYSRKLRNRKIWRYVRHIKPSVISTPLDYYNVIILQKWGITGIKLSILRKKIFSFVFNK